MKELPEVYWKKVRLIDKDEKKVGGALSYKKSKIAKSKSMVSRDK